MTRTACTCTPADNGGCPLPDDRVAMLHRPNCPLVKAAWEEYLRRVQAGEPSEAVITSMAARSAS